MYLVVSTDGTNETMITKISFSITIKHVETENNNNTINNDTERFLHKKVQYITMILYAAKHRQMYENRSEYTREISGLLIMI